jgi:DnaJ-domain-containing protein 1
MPGFMDRLAEFLRSFAGTSRTTRESDYRFSDPDVSEAWAELEEFMRSGKAGRTTGGERGHARGAPGPRDEDLRQDYANLEVPFGSDLTEVIKAYKRLILRYHPDKHSGDPEKIRIATEITKKINESFERIRARAGKG